MKLINYFSWPFFWGQNSQQGAHLIQGQPSEMEAKKFKIFRKFQKNFELTSATTPTTTWAATAAVA